MHRAMLNRPGWSAILALLLFLGSGCFQRTGNHEPTNGGLVDANAWLLPPIPTPRLDGLLDSGEWVAALHVPGAFEIASGSDVDGNYSFDAWFGQEKNYLYVAVRIGPMGENPHSNETTGWPERVAVLATTSTANELDPTSPHVMGMNHGRWGGTSIVEGTWSNGGWQGWGHDPDLMPGDFDNDRMQAIEGNWCNSGFLGEDYFWEFAFQRSSPDEEEWPWADLNKPPSFRLALSFDRTGPDVPYENTTIEGPYYDVAPAPGYSPEAANSPAEWWTFRFR